VCLLELSDPGYGPGAPGNSLTVSIHREESLREYSEHDILTYGMLHGHVDVLYFIRGVLFWAGNVGDFRRNAFRMCNTRVGDLLRTVCLLHF
jgi:hypothetical protein